jgi:hypothetical protein
VFPESLAGRRAAHGSKYGSAVGVRKYALPIDPYAFGSRRCFAQYFEFAIGHAAFGCAQKMALTPGTVHLSSVGGNHLDCDDVAYFETG